jgi:hypothetical protein
MTTLELAQQEFNRAVRNDMGIFVIAEVWGIQPYQVMRGGNGLLTEVYVVGKIAEQIEVDRGKSKMETGQVVENADSAARRKRVLCCV